MGLGISDLAERHTLLTILVGWSPEQLAKHESVNPSQYALMHAFPTFGRGKILRWLRHAMPGFNSSLISEHICWQSKLDTTPRAPTKKTAVKVPARTILSGTAAAQGARGMEWCNFSHQKIFTVGATMYCYRQRIGLFHEFVFFIFLRN